MTTAAEDASYLKRVLEMPAHFDHLSIWRKWADSIPGVKLVRRINYCGPGFLVKIHDKAVKLSQGDMSELPELAEIAAGLAGDTHLDGDHEKSDDYVTLCGKKMHWRLGRVWSVTQTNEVTCKNCRVELDRALQEGKCVIIGTVSWIPFEDRVRAL